MTYAELLFSKQFLTLDTCASAHKDARILDLLCPVQLYGLLQSSRKIYV
jgi:hypothetical protein